MLKLFLVLLFGAAVIFPQNKYYIFFKDKGVSSNASLSKTSEEYQSALALLTDRAIERRKQVMGDDIIRFEDLPLNDIYLQQISSSGVKIVNQLKWFNAVTAYLSAEQIKEVSEFPFVKEVLPVRKAIMKPGKIDKSSKLNKPTDFVYGLSYMQNTLSDIPEVHAKGINGSGVLVGLLDTGYDWSRHIAFQNVNVVGEKDFIQGDSVTANQGNDYGGQHDHGTAVFSIIAGYRDSILIGPAYGSSYLLAKTEYVPSETHGEEDNYAAALEWMESRGVDITSSSLGYNLFDTGVDYSYKDMDGKTTIVTRAAKLAFERGIITVTAAGNEGDDPWYFITAPADENNILGIGAVNSNRMISSFSSRGPSFDGRIKPDISAMGSAVFTAIASTTNDFGSGSGTSFAAPIAAGVASLLKSAYPYLDNIQVRHILLNTADNYKTPDNFVGYGIVSAKNALNLPNIRKIGTDIFLNKMFFTPKINSSSVNLYFRSGSDSSKLNLAYDGMKFSVKLPALALNAKTLFYFSYTDSAGQTFREPAGANTYYTYYYGKNMIFPSEMTAPVPFDYGTLSQNYPNPFNSATKINFIADLNDVIEIHIYNSIGERVRSFYPRPTFAGEQTILFNGLNFSNEQLPSGVYFYQLLLNGVDHNRKMILMR